jgi:hypothetical protein
LQQQTAATASPQMTATDRHQRCDALDSLYCSDLPVPGSRRGGRGFDPIRLIDMGYCLDDRDNSRSSGAVVQVWRCNRRPSQVWQVASDSNAPVSYGVTIRHNGLCLAASGTANGSKVTLQPCTDNGDAWPPLFETTVNPDYWVGLGQDNMVLDDPVYVGNGTQQLAWVNTRSGRPG